MNQNRIKMPDKEKYNKGMKKETMKKEDSWNK